MPHLLVQRGDGLYGGVPRIDVHSLFCVGVEVQQSSHKVLNETQGLTCYVPGFQLQPQKQDMCYKLNVWVCLLRTIQLFKLARDIYMYVYV